MTGTRAWIAWCLSSQCVAQGGEGPPSRSSRCRRRAREETQVLPRGSYRARRRRTSSSKRAYGLYVSISPASSHAHALLPACRTLRSAPDLYGSLPPSSARAEPRCLIPLHARASHRSARCSSPTRSTLPSFRLRLLCTGIDILTYWGFPRFGCAHEAWWLVGEPKA